MSYILVAGDRPAPQGAIRDCPQKSLLLSAFDTCLYEVAHDLLGKSFKNCAVFCGLGCPGAGYLLKSGFGTANPGFEGDKRATKKRAI